jgi:GTP-binding protein EngB required for normal cell division
MFLFNVEDVGAFRNKRDCLQEKLLLILFLDHRNVGKSQLLAPLTAPTPEFLFGVDARLSKVASVFLRLLPPRGELGLR